MTNKKKLESIPKNLSYYKERQKKAGLSRLAALTF